MPMNEPVLYEQNGRIVLLTLNHAKTRNALDAMMVEALVAACSRIDADMSVSCVVLRSSGPAFCSGGNVKDMKAGVDPFGGPGAQMRRAYRQGIHRVPRLLYELETPVIAVVDGPALGAGLDLALMCDIRLASERAVFAESFIRLGLVSGDGGAWLLPRIVGPSRASQMIFSGESIDASRALEWGLVSAVYRPDEVQNEALSLAARIACHPPQSLRLNKRLLRESERVSFSQSLDIAASLQALAQTTDDFREAIDALSAKREPVFRGL